MVTFAVVGCGTCRVCLGMAVIQTGMRTGSVWRAVDLRLGRVPGFGARRVSVGLKCVSLGTVYLAASKLSCCFFLIYKMGINKTYLTSRKIDSDDECNCFPPWHINAEKAPAIGGSNRLDWPWSHADWRGFTWYGVSVHRRGSLTGALGTPWSVGAKRLLK